jgi:hypothetical protein
LGSGSCSVGAGFSLFNGRTPWGEDTILTKK